METKKRGKRREVVACGNIWTLRQEIGGPVTILRPGSDYHNRLLSGVSIMSADEELKSAIATLFPARKPTGVKPDAEFA